MTQHNAFVYLDLGLAVIELSPTEWRVSDARRRDQGNGLSLIGFITQTAAGFEITEPGEPDRRTRMQTFPEALMTLSQWLHAETGSDHQC